MNNATETLEKRVIRKTMRRILPFALLLYIIAYLDRVNLGYAALQMNADLALTAEVFGLLSGIFFIGYFLFEVPSNMIMHKVGAKIWIARIMVTWGIISSLTAWAQTPMHLYILRFLLGVAEAGFFPGIILYLTYWFRVQERGRAAAFIIIAMPIGGMIGGPLSTWIMTNVEWLGWTGWRWMFVLEGLPAVLLGIVTLFYLTDRPRKAKWLTDEEKNWLETELAKEQQQKKQTTKTSKKEMFKDLNIWKLSFIYFLNFGAVYGLAFWLPSIIKSVSETLSLTSIGWLSTIPSIIAIPSMILWAWHSDKTNERRGHLMISFVIAAIGFIGCGFTSSAYMTIACIAFAAIGLYSFSGVFMSYVTTFFTDSTAPVGIATVNSLASLGGFFGPMVFGYFTFSTGMFFVGALLFTAFLVLLTMKNREPEQSAVEASQQQTVSAFKK
jgi:ACS family tartrate transporter-like MFS transporter